MLKSGLRTFYTAIILSSIISIRGLSLLRRRTHRTFSYKRMFSSSYAQLIPGSLQIPKVDDRTYHQFLLPNGISATVVHDRTSEKSSCALSVKTGAMNDPLPGVAHITEHAVFLGSEKYPVENAYKDHLNKHGGSSNAGTSMDQTTYKFNVNSDAFDQALDVFSQFFKGPLFRTEAMCREIMAVDSEDSKNRIIDSRRLLQVLKHQVDPQSSYAKFSTGNLNTLAYGDVAKYGEHLSGTIRSFHQRYYQPSKMAVSLVGPQPIEELKEMAERHFSNIASLSPVDDDAPSAQTAALPVEVLVRDKSLFTHGGGKLIKLRPIKDLRDMTVVWELPVTTHLYRRSPCSLISYLLAYKGEGSLFAALQDKQWATSVAAGVRTEFEDFTLFEATFSLTEDGLRHWEEVIALLYRSIDVLVQAGDADLVRYWAEMRTINALDFQYREKTTAYELAPQLSSHMLDYPPEHIISAGWLMDEHVDVSLVREFIAKLVADKSLVFLRSKAFVDSPLSLGNDDATYLDKKAFADYEAYKQERAGSAPDSKDGAVTKSATAEAELETSKRSGEYFRDMRRYQDAVYERAAESHADDGGVQRMEPFYGIPYNIENLRVLPHAPGEGPASIADIKIKLPPENRFVCTELIDGAVATVAPGLPPRAAEDCAVEELSRTARPLRSSAPVPVSARGSAAGEVWHSRDEVFGQPRSILFHLLPSRSCADGHPVLSLISQVFSQVCARKYFQPAVAGLSYSLNLGTRGVGLSFFGYSPKLPDFAAEVSRDVGSLSFWSSIDPSVVVMCKDRLLRAYRSWPKERPDAQCDSLMRYVLLHGAWLPQDRLSACEAMDHAYFQQRAAQALQVPADAVISYGHGDCSAEMVLRGHSVVTSNICAAVPVAGSGQAAAPTSGPEATRTFAVERSRVLLAGTHSVVALPAMNKVDPNSALLTLFQADFASPRTSALLLLLRRLLGEPAFTELRTKQQLGYIVSLSSTGYGRGWNALRGINVRILSQRFSPPAMEAALWAFLTSQRAVLHDMLTEDIVAARCQAIIRSLEDPPTTYSEEASDHWDSIVNAMPFDWTQQVIQQLKELDRQAVLRAAEEWVFDAAARRSMSMMIFSPQHEQERAALKETVSVTAQACASSEPSAKYCFSIDEMTMLRDSLAVAPQRSGE